MIYNLILIVRKGGLRIQKEFFEDGECSFCDSIAFHQDLKSEDKNNSS
ncbi:MAG: hypothetical protein ACLUIS_06445 [Longibaculum sp.]